MQKDLPLALNPGFECLSKIARKLTARKFIKGKSAGLSLPMAAKRDPDQLEPYFFLNDGDGHTLKVSKYCSLLLM